MIDKSSPKWHPYHGWMVQIISVWNGFSFHCYDSELAGGSWHNRKIYPTYQEALIAAQQFVDRQTAILALTQILQDWLNYELINQAEYQKAMRFGAHRRA